MFKNTCFHNTFLNNKHFCSIFFLAQDLDLKERRKQLFTFNQVYAHYVYVSICELI